MRNLFEWLPPFIVAVVESMDPHFIGWSTTGRRAVLASDFELFYLGDEPEQRQFLQPSLVYASVEEAVEALTKHIDILTGADLVNGLVNA